MTDARWADMGLEWPVMNSITEGPATPVERQIGRIVLHLALDAGMKHKAIYEGAGISRKTWERQIVKGERHISYSVLEAVARQLGTTGSAIAAQAEAELGNSDSST